MNDIRGFRDGNEARDRTSSKRFSFSFQHPFDEKAKNENLRQKPSELCRILSFNSFAVFDRGLKTDERSNSVRRLSSGRQPLSHLREK